MYETDFSMDMGVGAGYEDDDTEELESDEE
jgi:hypothetical protein